MIERDLAGLEGTSRAKKGEGFASYRFLLREDGMGFTLTETRSDAGLDMVIKYKNRAITESCVRR